MSNIDYSIFYKKSYTNYNQIKDKTYDVLISAFNDSKRVTTIFDTINAGIKHWLILPEYDYQLNEIPKGDDVFTFSESLNESEIVIEYFNKCGIENIIGKKICIDITGFIRPHLVFLVKYLSKAGFTKVDFIYTDPVRYVKKEETLFSNNCIGVRQINGCEGLHTPDTSNDFLIIGAGYDYRRIKDIAKDKTDTTKIHLFGFPSLQADMYQENILKVSRAIEDSAPKGDSSFLEEDYVIFAPANDPFITAEQIKKFVEREHKKKPITNLYLCPLSTKAQTLGFAIYYASESESDSTSIIFPFSSKYNRETTEGISKVWVYTVEFDAFT